MGYSIVSMLEACLCNSLTLLACPHMGEMKLPTSPPDDARIIAKEIISTNDNPTMSPLERPFVI